MTVNLDPSRAPEAELKRAALDALIKSKPGDAQRKKSSVIDAQRDKRGDAMVILASRSLASWLEDTTFVSQLLERFNLAGTSVSEPGKIHVLSAAVDEVPRFDRRRNFYASSEGLSILCGRLGNDLPSPWSEEEVKAGAQPCLEFRLPQVSYTGPLDVDIPLANTVFSNGRSHTLFASLWEANGAQGLRLVEKVEKTRQRIFTEQTSSEKRLLSKGIVACPLVPLTNPRKITAGLGNILRKIDINGESAPASRELEAIIPLLLEQRQKQFGQNDDPLAAGPVGVWALIMPATFARDYPQSDFLEPLNWKEYNPSDESRLAGNTVNVMGRLLAGGCQLRKILSGGGGWGSKQGLLSLDSQTSLAAGEQQDLEDFIKSFHGNRDSAGGIVAPGSYVQFFVEPAALPGQDSKPYFPWSCYAQSSPTLALGTSGAAPIPPQDGLAEAWPALFGAVSSQGIYLSRPDSAGNLDTVASKLDAPCSYTISTTSGFSIPSEGPREQ
ncbi:hypothetical protein MMYC01_208753 [Madurella mycetomatis]|uniref:Uncharacterized protein n=1 Tax=Madurella mycetomatis TaxID=100816 RepID=A0A175VR55_9PEZI|nr:hypothetical protein MMYC01_208753 [Madurella mycetomatis]